MRTSSLIGSRMTSSPPYICSWPSLLTVFEYRAFLSCNKEPLRGHDSTQDLAASMEAEAMVAKVGFISSSTIFIAFCSSS